MLSIEENELLTRVGPGTPMGNLLRRYWTPACLASEVPVAGGAPVRVRLLGESLVAFRDTSGTVGLVQENCAHRGASLYFGRNEDCAIRCPYHGWAFNAQGDCVDMPSEPRPFADRIKIKAYPTHESGGIVWTYMGPAGTMTPFRDFGSESIDSEKVFATKMLSTCNWVQAMEGNLDTAHISHLHQFEAIDEIPDDGSDKPGYPSNAMSWKFWRHDRTPRLEIEDTWYGYKYAGIRETPNGHTHVRITAYVVPYSTLVASIPFTTGHGLFVPMDDDNCARYFFVAQEDQNPRNYGGENLFAPAPYTTPLVWANGVVERTHTFENDYLIDREAHTVTFSGVSDFVSQDLMVTESMGPIYDRSQEHLGTTDISIIRVRTILVDAARALEQGKEPPALQGEFRNIRAAEKILEDGEDWRVLGTDDDPAVQDAFLSAQHTD
jgi:phenylpropionate dioxygenase-like ring-hydroxylating dioxygenase large terminal subunit